MSESTPAAPTLPQSAPSRRRVASSLAWAVPTVVAAAAAPAEAASPSPQINRVFLVARAPAVAVPGTTVTACDSTSTRLSVTTDDVNNYYRITNLRPGSTVTNVTASILVQRSVVDAMASRNNPLTWTSAAESWSNPTREVSGNGDPVLYTNNRIEYYRYYSTLNNTAVPAPAPASGTITLPRIQWYSNCSRTLAQSTGVMVNGRGSAVVNGTTTLVNLGAYRTV